jgi:hypothetical protein
VTLHVDVTEIMVSLRCCREPTMAIRDNEHEDTEQEKREEAEVAAAVAKCKVLNNYFDRRTAAWDYYLASRQGIGALAVGDSAGQMSLDFRDKSTQVAAAEEMAADFPTTNAQFVLHTCSNCESLCQDFLRACIEHDETLTRKHPLSKVKFSLTELKSMTDKDRVSALADAVMDELGAPNRIGVEKFHEVFSFVGFSFPIKKDWRNPLRELHAVRNVLLHRGGIIDQRFLSLCPWVSVEPGTVLRVTSFALSGYVSAVDGYMSRFKRSVVDRLQPTMKLIERSIETNERQIAQIEQQKELERAREADLARRIRETEGSVAERRRKKQTARKARSRKPAH